MSQSAISPGKSRSAASLARHASTQYGSHHHKPTPDELAARITRAASKQAYYTARALVDGDRRYDAYRAYAYFRWVDDELDLGALGREQRLAFVSRQCALVERFYAGERPDGLTTEERLLAELVGCDDEEGSGLQSYVRNMIAVMEFDAHRCGRLISGSELETYTLRLSTAVTDALHYFIGHEDAPPESESRYLAATGAHIAHMLRDTHEDIAAGYYNAPRELLERAGVAPDDVDSAPYRAWVRSRVAQARSCFRVGAGYLNQVISLRCRIAGFAYMARFTGVLDTIERDEYRLRPAYHETATISHGLRAVGWVGAHALLRGLV